MTEVGLGAYTYDFTVPTILGVYPYFTNCIIEDRKYFSLDTFHVYDFSTIPGQVWNNPSRNLTYTQPGLTANDVWTAPTRDLTYYPTVNLTLSNESVAALGAAVWQYQGPISSNILDQFSCNFENVLSYLKLNKGSGVYINSCYNAGVTVGP